MIKLKFAYKTDENGNLLADPNDIKPSKDNKSIYGDDIEKNNTNYNQIEKSMSIQGINDNPIPVYTDGTLKGGHTRLHIALKLGFKNVKIRIVGDRPETSYDTIQELISDNVDLREKNYLHCLHEYIALENSYIETHGMRPPKETEKEWVEKINSGTALSISANVIEQLRLIKERDPNLFEDVNSGKTKPGQAYNLVKKTQQKDSPRVDREVMKWMGDNTITDVIKRDFTKAKNSFINNVGYEDENGNFINLIIGKDTEIEENAITGMYSHILAGTITSVFQRKMPELGAVSPRIAGAPDTQFTAFDLPGVDNMRLETKFAQVLKNGTNFYGGEGATAINPHEFILAMRQGLHDFCMIVATMERTDWKSKTGGSICNFEKFMQKHYHEKGKTWFPIVGDVEIGNYGNEYFIKYETLK